jgi:RNA-directed DNA polymerase
VANYTPPKKHPWFRTRGYIHFDSPIALRKAQALVMSSHSVSKHAFFPLINYAVESHKFQINSIGGPELKLKTRPIAYAAHADAHIYAYYGLALGCLYEKKVQLAGLSANVLAFRSLGKSNIEFANEAFEYIKNKKTCSVVALDISGFFDNLDHEILKSSWANLLEQDALPADHFNIFKSLTKFSTVDKDKLYDVFGISKTNPKNGRFRVCNVLDFRQKVRKSNLIETNTNKYGIPQGSPISALLSNIYMLEFDKVCKAVMERQGGIYLRYCDDILFITDADSRDDIETFAINEIQKLELKINVNKTEIRDFTYKNGKQTSNKPLQYLGFTFDGERKLIRSAALARFSNRMKRGVKLAKSTQRKRNQIKASKGCEGKALYKRKLYEQYSHLGNRNFVTYGYRAADIMHSEGIRKQLKPLWERLQNEIDK